MGRQPAIYLVFISMLFLSGISTAFADDVNRKAAIESVLKANVGKRVSIVTKSGQELTGTVKDVTDGLTHLAELSGREFFDAMVVTRSIEAVVFRTRTQ